MNSLPKITFFLFISLASLRAQTWTGAGANDNFNTSDNWSPASAPTNGSSLTFNGTTRLSPNNDFSSFFFNNITFDTAAGAFTIGGNAFTLNGSIVNNSISNQTFSGGAITATAGRTVTTQTGNVTFSAALAGSGGAFTFHAGSTLLGNSVTLSGTNSNTGTTTVNAGNLRLDYATNNTSKLGDSSQLSLQGATLDLSGGSHNETVATNTFGTAQNRITRSSGTSNMTITTFTAPTAALDISESGMVSIGNTLTLSNGIVSPRLTIGGANWATQSGSQLVSYTAYTSLPTIGGSTLTQYSVTNNTTLTGAVATSNLKIDASVAGQSLNLGNNNLNTANGGLLYTGANDFTITSGSGNINSRLWQVWGTGNLTVSGNLNPASNGALEKYGTGKLIINGTLGTTNATPLVISSGAVQVNSNAAVGNQTTGGSVTLRGGTLIADTAAGSFGLYNGSEGTNNRSIALAANGGGLDVIGGNTFTVSGTISSSSGTVAPLIIGSASSNGTVELKGTNTYTTSTILNGGTLKISSITNGSVAGTLGNSTSAANNLVLGGGTLEYAGTTNGSTDRNFTLTPGTSSGIQVSNSTVSLTLSGAAGNTTGALTKSGAGTLILSGANTYTGSTTISAGTLQIGNAGTTGSLSTSSAITNNATLAFNRTNTVTQGTDFASTISGTGNLIQAGSGNLVLTGANSYSGSTIIQAGTLQIGNGGTTGGLGSANSITNNATLAFNRSDAFTFSTLISGTGGIRQAGSGTTILTANNTYTGATAISSGTLELAPASGTNTLTGNVTGAGALVKSGAGTIILAPAMSANNTFSGALSVNGGVLQIGNATTGNNQTQRLTAVTSINVASGATLTLGATSSLPDASPITLNGTLNTISTSQSNRLGPITMNGGTLTTNNAPSSIFQSYILNGNVTIGGSLASTINSAGSSNNGIHLAANVNNTTRVFNVADATSSSAGDLFVSAALLNSSANATFVTGLEKTGAGTMVLSASNAYIGATTISAGTLQIGNGGTTGSLSTSSAITNDATLAFNRSNAVVQGTDFSAAAITGTGMVIQNSSSTTTLNNSTNTFSGGVWVQQGTLYADTIGNSGSASYLGSGTTIKLGNGTTGGTLRITGTGTETTDKVIDLSGTTGGGTITNLSSNITFTSNLAMSGSGAKTFNLASSGSNTSTTNFYGLLSDANGTLSVRMNGSGNANFGLGNENNSFSGAVTLDGNTSGKTYTLSVGGLGNATANSYLGRNATINIGSTNGANTLSYTGSGETTNKVINLSGTVGSAGLDQSGTGLLKFTSNFTATGVGAKTLTLQGSTAGTGEVAGIIVDSSGGATSVQKSGSGTWTLSGNNTYTGQSLLNAGVTTVSTIRNFGQSSSLGQGTSGTGIRMGSTTTTGTLAYTGSGNTSNRTFQVGSGNGTGGATLTNNGSGALVFTASAFNSADTSSVSGFSNRTLTLRGSNTGNNEIQGGIINNTNGMVSVTKNDAGTWILSGNNTYTGATTITAGTLVLNGTNSGSAISVNSGGTLAGSGTGGATTVNSGGKIGPGNSPGTLTVGDLTLNGGGTYTWEMANATGSAGTGWDQLNATGLLTIGSNATSTFTIAITSSGAPANWNYATTNQTWDILDYGTISGFNASYFTLNSTAFGGDLTPDSSWSLTDTGSALRLTYNYTQNTPTYDGATGIWSTGFTPAITNSANAVFFGTGGTATNDIASATLSGIGSLTFDGTNSYTLEANSGSAGYNSASALAIGGTIVNNSSAVQTINLATSFAANQTINANTGGIVVGGNIAVASGAALTVVGSNNTTMSGVVSGLGGLTKNSSSTLTLSGNNTYSGNTTIGQGKVLIGDNNAFGTGSVKLGISGVNATITLASTDSTARTISNPLDTFAGNSWVTTFGESSGGTGNLSFTSGTGVSLGSTSRTFNVLNTTSLASGFSTVSGAIVKTGSGTLILTGASTYNGSTTINAGTLQLGNGGTTGSLSAASAITNNGTLVFNRSNTVTQGTAFASAIGGTGHVIQAGSGTLVFSGANTYTGSTAVSAGNLTISNASALGGTGSGTTVANGAALQIQGDIAVGAEALNLAGSGFSNAGALRNLSGTNSLSGAITLSGATTIGSDAGALTLSGGISGTQNLTLTGAGNTTISGAIATSTGTLTKNGSGTATLSTANTYTGSTTVNSGTLQASAANALGNSTVINVDGGSFLVTASNAVNDNAAINLNGGTLAVSGTFEETVGALTLSANSTIDLAGFTGTLRFGSVGSWDAGTNLAIWNWNGINQYGTPVGDGANNRHVVFTNNSGLSNYLDRISFYSDSGSSFVGNAFEEGFSGGTEIIAVPEAETYLAAIVLLAGIVIQYLRLRAKRKSFEHHLPEFATRATARHRDRLPG